MPSITGLNIFRAIAVIMMIIAHSIRIQSNFTALMRAPHTASLWDQCLLFFIHIEPIISAQFLFISGFSLTLSLFKQSSNPSSAHKRRWLLALPAKLFLLYGISVLFFVGDNGLQFPDLFVSSGILSIIAVSMAISGILLTGPKPIFSLTVATIVTLLLAYYLEQSKTSIIGLNAGAGGAIPLLCMTFIGAIIGIIFQRHGTRGLFISAAIGCFVGILTMIQSYPWIFTVKSQFQLFPGDPVSSVIHSFQYALGLGDVTPTKVRVQFWNHSSIFALRVTGTLTLVLALLVVIFTRYNNRWTQVLNTIGQHALLIYVLHLLLLGALEISGVKPTTGWQTTLLVISLVMIGFGVILIRNKSGSFRRKLFDSFDPGTQ